MKIVFFFSLLFSTLCFPKETLSSENLEKLINQVIFNCEKLKTLECKIIQNHIEDSVSTEMVGQIRYKAPDSILVHYFSPLDQTIFSGKQKFIHYSNELKRAVMADKDSLTKIETTLLEKVSFIKMNHFKDMRNDYVFSHFSTRQDGLIINATPKTGWKNLSMILIKMDAERYLYLALELFDKNKKLIYQIKYSDYSEFNGVLFPTKIYIGSISNNRFFEETINFSRIKINEPLDRALFSVDLPKDVKITRPYRN